jgi:hypothetical protein
MASTSCLAAARPIRCAKFQGTRHLGRTTPVASGRLLQERVAWCTSHKSEPGGLQGDETDESTMTVDCDGHTEAVSGHEDTTPTLRLLYTITEL